MGMGVNYNGMNTELGYLNESGTFGTFLKMASNRNNLLFV